MAGKVQMQGRNTVTQEVVTWVATSVDWAGAESPVPVTDVALYARAPTPVVTEPTVSIEITIDSPIEGESYSVGDLVVIYGTISRPGTVVLTSLGTASDDDATWSYSWTPSTVGSFTITATATDAVNGTTDTVSVVVTVVAARLPATLPSLTLWVDGLKTGYSDAGTTIATAPYGRVAQIAQPSPLTGNWTASGSARPWKESNALDFHLPNPSLLLQPTSVAIPANNCTLAAAWQHRLGQMIITPFAANTSGGVFGVYITSGLIYLARNGGIAVVAGIPAPVIVAGHLIADVTLIVTCTPTQYEIKMTVNGVAYSVTVAVTPPSGNLGTIQLGEWTSGGAPHAGFALSQFVATAQALNSTQQADLQTYLLANLASDPPVTAPLIMTAGDSISAAWPPGWQASLDANATPPRVMNSGVAGSKTSLPTEQPTFYVNDVLPYYSASRAKNILVMEGISVNDVALLLPTNTPSATAALVLTSYYAYLDRAKADGWIVIACTMSPNLGGADYDSARAIINADIRANWAAHANYLCDLGAAPGMSTTADAANTALFYDGTHVTAAGYLIWDSVLLPVLTTALAA